MVQLLFIVLTCLFQQKCNRLKAWVVIYAYQHHVRLLPSEPVVVMQPQSTRVEGADIVMQSGSHAEIDFDDYAVYRDLSIISSPCRGRPGHC